MGERALQEKMEEISKMEQDYHILKEQVEKLRGVDEATDSQPSSPTKPFSPVSPSSEEEDPTAGPPVATPSCGRASGVLTSHLSDPGLQVYVKKRDGRQEGKQETPHHLLS